MQRRAFIQGVFAFPIVSGKIASAQATTDMVELRLAAQPGDELTPVLYAQKAGWFAKVGLSINVQRLSSGAAISAAVAGGSLDIGKSSLLPLVGARSRGISFVLVAPGLLWLTESPTAGLIALKSTTIASGADLNDKTLSTSALKDLGEIGIRAWIDQHGGDSRTVRFVEIPSSSVVAALETHRSVAGNLVDPIYSEALASGKIQVVGHPDDAIAKRFLTTAWFANEDYVATNRNIVNRFVRVLQQASEYTNAHQSEMIPLIAPFWGIAPDLLAQMHHGTIAGYLDPRDIQPVIDIAAKYHAIEKSFAATEMISPVALRSGR